MKLVSTKKKIKVINIEIWGKIIGVLVIFMFLNCSQKDKALLNNSVNHFETFVSEDSLHFQDLFDYKKGEIRNLILFDSTIIIVNSSKSKYFCYNYSLNHKILSQGYLERGKGPNEAIGIFTSGLQNNILWFHDLTKQRVFNIKKDSAINEIFPKNFTSYKLNDFYFHISLVDSLKYLGVGNLSSRRKVSICHIRDKALIERIGEFGLIPQEIPLAPFIDSYSSNILVKPHGEKAVLFYRYTDVVEIINLKTNKFYAIQGPDNFDVFYEIGDNDQSSGYMKKTNKTRKAFVNGTVSNNYIYLLYSGCHYNDENWSYGLNIHIYNWNGTPVKKYILDRPLYTIGISKDDKCIYSYDNNSGKIIYSNLQ